MDNKMQLFGSKMRSSICRSAACWALFWLAVITNIQQLPFMAECFPLHISNTKYRGWTSLLTHDVSYFIGRRTVRSKRTRARRLLGIYTTAASDSDDDDNSNTIESFDWSTAIDNNQDDGMDKQREEAENIYIPKGGISVSDEIEASQRDRFQTEVVPIKGLSSSVVAQLVTTSMTRDSFEPVRYLVSLSSAAAAAAAAASSPKFSSSNGKTLVNNDDDDDKEATIQTENLFVMVDVPPYSPRLVAQMQAFMRESNSNDNNNNCRLAAILITSRDAIHYDEAPGAYTVRRSHVTLWKQALPDLEIVAYRLDIPRDCRSTVTQILDGQGPFGAGITATTVKNANSNELSFVEMGRPLTYEAWDYQTAQQVLRGEKPPPDDDQVVEDASATTTATTAKDNDDYSAEAIRKREAERSVLAVFTPGHTFGSLSFVFPQLNVCCSGFCIPVEDNRAQYDDDDEGNNDNDRRLGDGGTGPALDVRGYITTSRAGITRQMESAKKLVQGYSDRFHTVLPSRGDPLFLDEDSVQERQAELLEIIQQYKRIGEIYDQLGITSKDDNNNNNKNNSNDSQ